MALTAAQAITHAEGFLKVPASYASNDEVRIANTINDFVANFTTWSWRLTAGVDIAVSAGTQDYSMNSADQNDVNAISTANLLSGSTDLSELLVGAVILPVDETQKQPVAVCLLSETQIRLWGLPDATYTFQWNYHKRATEFAATSENWDIPPAMAKVVKTGVIWQYMEFADDIRAPEWEKKFFIQLQEAKKEDEIRTGRRAR